MTTEPGYAEGKKEAERLAGLKAKKDALRAQGISVKKPQESGSVEDRLAEQVMKYRHDPARFVKFAYPWGEEGELKEAYGPRIWQGDILDEIGDHLRSEKRFKPLQLSVASGHGIGKALAHGEPVLTPRGWVAIEEIQAGDEVMAGDGTATYVTGVFPQGKREVFLVMTDDGGAVVVDGDHQWFTTTRSERKHEKSGQVRTTREIASSLTFPNGPNEGLNHCIPVCGPVAFADRQLPIDPYIFGCWLGDGDAVGRITGVEEAFESLEMAGAVLGRGYSDTRSRAVTRSVLGIRPALRELNVYGSRAHEKWIPEAYMLGSIEQRIALLQGLMDTDGSANDHGALVFEVVSPRLADGVAELARSLGGVVRRSEKMGSYDGKECRLVYRLFLSLPEWLIPFRSTEKKSHYRPQWGHRNCDRTRQRFIASVEPVGEFLATCIAVNHPSQLFITRDYIVTHNTALIAWITNWAMSTCVDCRVIVTAGTGKQLDTKTWPEVIKWFKLGINGHWFDTKAESICARDKVHERLWRADAITWSENNVDPFAGLHNKGKRIVVVFDEASSVADKIWEVTSGALTDEGTEIIWIAFGNPTQNVGMFRECFGRFKHRWVTKQIDSRMVDGTNKELFSQWVEDYGEDSDYVRVRVKGEFPRSGSTQFISGEVVEGARKRTAQGWEKDWKILVADVARFGDDMTVFGVRQGDKFHKVEKHRGLDTMQTAMRLEARIREENPRLVVIDGDGLGAGVVDHVRLYMGHWFLTHAPSRLVEFHGGSGPRDGDMYYNRRAECWGLMRKWLETGDIPDDSEMAMDLTGPVYYFSMHNQIQLERKEDMKKRGLASPDLGDCLAMSFVESPAARTREEKLVEEIAAVSDPYEQHWMRLKETEHRMRMRKPKNWWE